MSLAPHSPKPPHHPPAPAGSSGAGNGGQGAVCTRAGSRAITMNTVTSHVVLGWGRWQPWHRRPASLVALVPWAGSGWAPPHVGSRSPV